MMKDPYNLAFVQLEKGFRERELEQGLMEHIQKFLLELGQGFAFVGRQVSLVVDEKEYFLDLLFYHLKLRRYIVIEVKAREFHPKDISQILANSIFICLLLMITCVSPTINLQSG